MKSLRIPLSLAVLVLLGTASLSRAASLRFEPSAQSIAVDELVSVDLVISGLGVSGAPSLGGFDLEVRHSASVIAFTGATFGSFLGNVGLGEAQTEIVVAFERTNLLALSFLSGAELDSLQPSDSFLIATLTFRGVAPGTSSLDLANVLLSDANGDALPIDATFAGSVTVIPEPSTALLLGLGLSSLSFRVKANDR